MDKLTFNSESDFVMWFKPSLREDISMCEELLKDLIKDRIKEKMT